MSHPALLSWMDQCHCFCQQAPPSPPDLLDPCHELFPTHNADILGQLPCLHTHIYQRWEPVCALVGSLNIWSCLVTVIYFSLCHKLLSFVCCFQQCFTLSHMSSFLCYDIQLCYFFSLMKIRQLNTQAGIISSYWPCYIAPNIYFLWTFSNNQTKRLNFTSVMLSISIRCAAHRT